MRKGRLFIVALSLLFLMGGCWRGYYNHPRNGYEEGQECTSENPSDCQPHRGYHGCGMW